MYTGILSERTTAAAAAADRPKMPRTKNIPRRCEGDDPAVREQQRAAALAAAPAPHDHAPPSEVGAGGTGVTVNQEEREDEEETPQEPRCDQLGLAPGATRMPASGPRAAFATAPPPAPAPAPHHGAPAAEGAGPSGVTQVKEEVEEEETLAQLRDRLGLSARVPAPGSRATFVHVKVEDSTCGEKTDGAKEDTGWEGEDVVEEVEGEVEEEEGHGGEEVEEEEDEEDEAEGEDDEVEYRDLPGGGGKRKRAEDTAEPAPPASLLPPPPQHMDVKWVEGQEERCSRSKRKHGGTAWRCYSAAIPGRAHSTHHAAQSEAGGKRARQKRTGSLLPASAGDAEGGVRARDGGRSGGRGGDLGGGREFTSTFHGISAMRGSGR